MSRRTNYRRPSSSALTPLISGSNNKTTGDKTPLINSMAMSGSIMMNKSMANTATGVGWGVATFLLVNTALGAGMLNYPYAYNQIGGVLMASLMQVILLVFITSTMIILVYCADFNQDDTYHDVLLSMCGKRAQQLSALSILLTCYGINITFLVIIGDQYDRIFNSLLPGFSDDAWYLDRKFTIFVTSILFIWPMCYAQRLDFLKHASILGMFAMLYVAFLTVYEHFVLDETTIAEALRKSQTEIMIENVKQKGSSTGLGMTALDNNSTIGLNLGDSKMQHSVKWFQPLAVIPILCFAYQTHEVIVPVYACMKERVIGKFMKATVFSLVLLFILYNLVGAFGYLTFGSNVPADIMSLYDGKDPVVVIGIVALVVKFITTYPPLMFCGRSALDGLYGEFRKLSTDEFKSSERTRRVVISTVWFLTTVALAAFAPDISVTLQLLGSMASINVFVFPGMCLVSLTRRLRRARRSLLLDETDVLGNGTDQQRAKDYYLISGSYFGALKKNATANSLASQQYCCSSSGAYGSYNICIDPTHSDSGNYNLSNQWINPRFKATFASLVELENNSDSASSSRGNDTHAPADTSGQVNGYGGDPSFLSSRSLARQEPASSQRQLQNGYGSASQHHPLRSEELDRVMANCLNSSTQVHPCDNLSIVDRRINDSYDDYSDCNNDDGTSFYQANHRQHHHHHGSDPNHPASSAPSHAMNGHESHNTGYIVPSSNTTTTTATTYKRTADFSPDALPQAHLQCTNNNQSSSFPDRSTSIANNGTSNPYCNSLLSERYNGRQHQRQNNHQASWMNRSTTSSLIDRLGFFMAPSTVAQIGISRCTAIGLYLFSALLILFGMFIFVLELVDVFGFL